MEASRHKLDGRINPDECAKIFEEDYCSAYESGIGRMKWN